MCCLQLERLDQQDAQDGVFLLQHASPLPQAREVPRNSRESSTVPCCALWPCALPHLGSHWQGPDLHACVVDLDRALLLFLKYPLRPLLCRGVVSPGFSLGCRVPGVTQVAKSTCGVPSTGYGPSASALRFRLVPSRYRYSRLSRVSSCRVPASPSLCFRSLFGGTKE